MRIREGINYDSLIVKHLSDQLTKPMVRRDGKIRAKCGVTEVTKTIEGAICVSLIAVYDHEKEVNERFSKATPAGSIELWVDNTPWSIICSLENIFLLISQIVSKQDRLLPKPGADPNIRHPMKSLLFGDEFKCLANIQLCRNTTLMPTLYI